MKKPILIVLLLYIFCLGLKAAQRQVLPDVLVLDTGKAQIHSLANFDTKPFPEYLAKGFLHSAIFNLSTWTSLLAMPQSISKWDPALKFKFENIRDQYISTYTKAPIIDTDLWSINYIGHPYQGSFYYNSVRSQGAGIWESAAFCVGQSLLWEFIWEGGMEQPSIQDLLVTPILGSVLGELSHRAALRMSKHGYEWHEKVIVCIINPSFAINVGFRRKR